MINIEKVIALDIETVPIAEHFDSLPEDIKMIFKKQHYRDKGVEVNEVDESRWPEYWREKASFSPIFSKVCAVSLVRLVDGKLKVGQYYGEDERAILRKVQEVLAANSGYQIAAHYGKGFDFPFLTARMFKNNIPIPPQFDNLGKKPWEMMGLVDTKELANSLFGRQASLVTLCVFFGIGNPKDDLDGSLVAETYFRGEYKRIADYCTKDTVGCFNVLVKMLFNERSVAYEVGSIVEKLYLKRSLVDEIVKNKRLLEQDEQELREIFEGSSDEEKQKLKDILWAVIEDPNERTTQFMRNFIKI